MAGELIAFLHQLDGFGFCAVLGAADGIDCPLAGDVYRGCGGGLVGQRLLSGCDRHDEREKGEERRRRRREACPAGAEAIIGTRTAELSKTFCLRRARATQKLSRRAATGRCTLLSLFRRIESSGVLERRHRHYAYDVEQAFVDAEYAGRGCGRRAAKPDARGVAAAAEGRRARQHRQDCGGIQAAVPGPALPVAFSKNGQFVYNQAFGMADREQS